MGNNGVYCSCNNNAPSAENAYMYNVFTNYDTLYDLDLFSTMFLLFWFNNWLPYLQLKLTEVPKIRSKTGKHHV